MPSPLDMLVRSAREELRKPAPETVVDHMNRLDAHAINLRYQKFVGDRSRDHDVMLDALADLCRAVAYKMV